MIRTVIKSALVVGFSVFLVACGDTSPGPLAGTWRAGGVMPLQSTFRSGEMESMGIIEKVGYKTDGNSVIVTMKDGMMKGAAVRYTLIDGSTMQAMGMTYRKMSN